MNAPTPLEHPLPPPPAAPKSIGPKMITWPIVAMMLIKEAPGMLLIAGGVAVGIVIALKNPDALVHALMAVIGPGVITMLGRSRPADSPSVATLFGGGIVGVVLLAAVALHLFH